MKKLIDEKVKKKYQNKKAAPPTKRSELFVPTEKYLKFVREGFTKIPNPILHDPGLSSQDLRVLGVLIHHTMSKYECFPSLKCLAFGARCCVKTLTTSLKKLRALKYIDWKKKGKSNNYVIIHKAKKASLLS